MGRWKIIFTCEDGFEGEEIVAAVNKFMAWDTFSEIAKEYASPVVAADCIRIKEED